MVSSSERLASEEESLFNGGRLQPIESSRVGGSQRDGGPAAAALTHSPNTGYWKQLRQTNATGSTKLKEATSSKSGQVLMPLSPPVHASTQAKM